MIRPIFSNSQFFPSLTPAPRPPWRRFYRAALGCHQGHCHQTQSPAPPMAEGTGWPWSTNRSMAAKSPAVTQWWHPHLGKKYYIYIYKYHIYILNILYIYVIYIYVDTCWYAEIGKSQSQRSERLGQPNAQDRQGLGAEWRCSTDLNRKAAQSGWSIWVCCILG